MSASPFEHLFDISPFPAVVSRLRDHSVVAINRRTSEMFGISHAEALGRSYQRLLCRHRAPRTPEGAAGEGRPRRQRGAASQAAQRRHLLGTRFGADGHLGGRTSGAHRVRRHQLPAERATGARSKRAASGGAKPRADLPHRPARRSRTTRLRIACAPFSRSPPKRWSAERVSMWRFDDGRSSIECIGLFRSTEAKYETGARLLRSHRAGLLRRDRTGTRDRRA